MSNNNCPKFSNEELITVYLWGKAQQLLTRKAIYNYTKRHLLAWFPALPSYQAFCRRLNRLSPAFQALAEIWAEEVAEKSGDTHHYDVLRSGDCSHFYVSSARQPIESFFYWANLKTAFQNASRARFLHGIFFLVFSALAFIAFWARFYY